VKGRALAAVLAAAAGCGRPDAVVGSKKSTESVVLGEAAVQLLARAGARAGHERQLGGTRILWNALLSGDIDLYPEYTGTLREDILAGRQVAAGDQALAAALAADGVRMSAPLGFNDTYAIGMREETAARLGIRTLSDLARHPDLAIGLSHEFLDRSDGWQGLRGRYRLGHEDVRGMDHEVAYRALESGAIQATDLYSTDAEIRLYRLRALEDDLHYFPAYHAVFVYRADLDPRAVAALGALAGRIGERDMIAMNARAVVDRVDECQVAADFLAGRLGLAPRRCREAGLIRRVWDRTLEHLLLVGVSLLAALLIAVPLGVACAKLPRLAQPVLGAVAVLQTIPSLALLSFLIPLLGIGALPAIAAMFLYSLLPIVRNTATGLTDIPPALRESAEALGLSPSARLRLVELPMASRAILAGIKTAAVINVGVATIGALIGAGGYGQPILIGLRVNDHGLILEGAVPAAALALLLEVLFGLLERVLVSRGLRLEPAR
jgi:osmoprotectant transport system permease protein